MSVPLIESKAPGYVGEYNGRPLATNASELPDDEVLKRQHRDSLKRLHPLWSDVLQTLRERSERGEDVRNAALMVLMLPEQNNMVAAMSWEQMLEMSNHILPKWAIEQLAKEKSAQTNYENIAHFVFLDLAASSEQMAEARSWGQRVSAKRISVMGESSQLRQATKLAASNAAMKMRDVDWNKLERQWKQMDPERQWNELVRLFDVAPEYLSKAALHADVSTTLKDVSSQCCICGKMTAIQLCSRCKVVGYCDRPCQKLHWPNHKQECAMLRQCFPPELTRALYRLQAVMRAYPKVTARLRTKFKRVVKKSASKAAVCIFQFASAAAVQTLLKRIEKTSDLSLSEHEYKQVSIAPAQKIKMQMITIEKLKSDKSWKLCAEAVPMLTQMNLSGACPIQIYVWQEAASRFQAFPVVRSFPLIPTPEKNVQDIVKKLRSGARIVASESSDETCADVPKHSC